MPMINEDEFERLRVFAPGLAMQLCQLIQPSTGAHIVVPLPSGEYGLVCVAREAELCEKLTAVMEEYGVKNGTDHKIIRSEFGSDTAAEQ